MVSTKKKKKKRPQCCPQGKNAGLRENLKLIDIDLLLIFALAVLVEFDVVLESVVTVGVGLVNLSVLGQLAVGLETPGLVGGVFHDHVALLVLVLAQRQEDDVALVDPDLLPQLATNVRQSLLAVEAERLQAPVTQHLHDLCILLAFFLEDKLSLLVVVFVLSTTAVLTALFGVVSIFPNGDV